MIYPLSVFVNNQCYIFVLFVILHKYKFFILYSSLFVLLILRKFYHFLRYRSLSFSFSPNFIPDNHLLSFVPYLSTSCLPLVSFFLKLTRFHLLPFASIASSYVHIFSLPGLYFGKHIKISLFHTYISYSEKP